MSFPKTIESADVRETSQIIYHSKGLDDSYQANVSLIKFEWLSQKLWTFE